MRLVLQTAGPFHLEATVRLLQRLPLNRVDVWVPGASEAGGNGNGPTGRYVRVVDTGEGPFLCLARNAGSIDEPALLVEVRGQPPQRAQDEIRATLAQVLGLHQDPRPFERLAGVGQGALRGLLPLVQALRGMRPPRYPSLFETFANVIPFQQVSLAAAAQMVARLVECFGEPFGPADPGDPGPGCWRFPKAATIAAEQPGALREIGLSTAKAVALHGIARRICAGELTAEALASCPTPEALALLRTLPGIGPWSAALVLLRGLQRMDCFPSPDAGVARGLARLLGEPGIAADRATVDRCIEHFGSYRGYLYFYSLAAMQLERGLIRV